MFSFSDKNTLLEFGALWWDNQNRYMPFFAPSVAALNSDDDVFISVFLQKKVTLVGPQMQLAFDPRTQHSQASLSVLKATKHFNWCA